MAAPLTDWRARVNNLDIIDPTTREVLVWEWMEGSDDQVVADLAPRLDDGETLTNVTATLWQLRASNETDDEDKTAAMVVGEPTIADTVVLVRLHNLERGRYYRLKLLYGAPGNHRGSGLIVRCVD